MSKKQTYNTAEKIIKEKFPKAKNEVLKDAISTCFNHKLFSY